MMFRAPSSAAHAPRPRVDTPLGFAAEPDAVNLRCTRVRGPRRDTMQRALPINDGCAAALPERDDSPVPFGDGARQLSREAGVNDRDAAHG